MDSNLRHGLIFLATLALLGGGIMAQTRSVAGFRIEPVDFSALDAHDYVVGSGWSRRQEASIKLGYLENFDPPKLGVFGNHQIQFFGGFDDPQLDEPAEFFNYWYANLSLTELRDYVYYTDSIGKLPSETLLVHITTPNNDNGANIIDYHDELPEDINHFFERQRSIGSFMRSTRIRLSQMWHELRYLTDWKTVAASMLGKGRYLLVDMRDCGRVDVASGPPSGGFRSLLARVGVSTASANPEIYRVKQLQRLCVGDLMHVIRRDGSAFRNTNQRELVLNEESVDAAKNALGPGDADRIAREMRDIAELVESRGRKVAFLITPVHETDRFSVADQIFDEALEKASDLQVIDHRHRFRDAHYFESFDHPKREYFDEVIAELRERELL